VIARVSGWGQDGPWAQRPGHDLNYQGLAGLVASQPLSGNAPAMPGFQAADLAGALVAALGIVAALVERTRNNRGKVLDVSLAESALSLHHPHITSLTAEGRTARPGGELLTGALPVYGTYRCADGQYLTVGALEPKFQAALAAEVGVPSRAALVGAFGQESRDVWVERLEQACVAPVLTATELADHPHWAARKSLVRLGQASFVRPPFAPASWSPGPVAKVGEHGRDILLEAGFSKSETQSLVESRVVAGPWTSS
jgi:alpha-methylacyl-CoA racemase